MPQEILEYSVYTNANLYVTCPHCDHQHKMDLPAFVHAINRWVMLVCVACGTHFTISLVRQTRVVEHRDEAVGEGAEESPKTLRTED